MKKYILIPLFVLMVVLFLSCGKDFLEYMPKGTISEESLQTPERIEGLVISAYAGLGSGNFFGQLNDLWMMGSIRSDDSYKGGGSQRDGGVNDYEQFYSLQPSSSYINEHWYFAYEAISRANEALRQMENISEEEFPLKKQRQAEMRFLRGHYHFNLKIIFKYPVFADDKIEKYNLGNISNREYTNDGLWNKIAEDFQFAINNLPENQEDIGRPNKYAACAYLAKVRLYQAYEQDEQHNVTGINQDRLQEVIELTDMVINSNKYALFNDYGKNFLIDYENGIESIFAVQYSIDDGTTTGRLNCEIGLNHNMAPEYGCCWFHVPSQNLVNAFKTNEDGLPLFNSFNETDMIDSMHFWINSVDPRLDHTIGIPGHPYKYGLDWIYTIKWARAPQIYGPYSCMKEIQSPDCNCVKRYFPYNFSNPKNYDIIRFDDVLLWKAEALIELGRHAEALPLVNQIRERANNSREMLKYMSGGYVSNYFIQEYQPGINCNWSQEYARNAIRFERRMEFGMECCRFFDLVRWGIAAETINEYFLVEKTKRTYLSNAYFKKNRDEYMPIPQTQIDRSQGLYLQNFGW